jgi:GMP synthase-like glutamine amidotransferase
MLINTQPKQEPEVVKKATIESRTCSILRDHIIEYPELWMEVYVNDGDYSAFAEMFSRARCKRATSIEEADLVVFTGGPDVQPFLYGETNVHPKTTASKKRDERDIDCYTKAQALGVPMVGFCRGAQFLHVMNGGSLYQHVDGHVGDHAIYDIRGKEFVPGVSSTHHQMCVINNRMTLIATATKSTERWYDGAKKSTGQHTDVEAYFYEETCCLGIQGHPEFRGYPRFTKWSLEQIQNYIGLNPWVKLVKGKFRNTKAIQFA